MPYFGDIFIPWLTSKDTSIPRDVVEKNFVDEAPQVYEVNVNLESGSYSAILSKSYHEEDHTLSEQEDAVLSMVDRHGSEFPYQSGGDKGYALVNSANVTRIPSSEIREAELEIRYIDVDDYRGAIRVNPDPYGDEYANTASPEETIVGIPALVDVVGEDEIGELQIEGKNISLYLVTENTIFEYQENEYDLNNSQEIGPCRLSNSNGERIFSDQRTVDEGSTLTNSIIRADNSTGGPTIEYYNTETGSWEDVGVMNIAFSEGHASPNTNERITIQSINGNEMKVDRGIPAIEFTMDGQPSFDVVRQDQNVTFVSENDYYAHWQVGDNNLDVIVVRSSSEGSFYTDVNSNAFGISGLDDTQSYSGYVAVVPYYYDADIDETVQFNVDDYARYIYNIGRRERTFTQA